jgi:uncharacterized protein YgfB (UPF0149 family)
MDEKKSAFHSLRADLRKAGVMEEEFHWVGLVEGMLCRGFEPSDRAIVKTASDLLNGSQAMPGVLVAELATLGFELKERLDRAADELVPMPSKEDGAQLRLETLSDFCHALTLGLSCDPMTGMQNRLPRGDLADFVQTLGEITRVDTTEAEVDEESYREVLAYIREHLLDAYKKSKA